MKFEMKKLLKWAVIILAVLFAAMQMIRPVRTNPPVDESRTIQANTQMTPAVAAILDRSCNDCHSSKTQWPWYSNVAPVSWFLINDVNDGRRQLSFSEWTGGNPRRPVRKLQEMCEQVETGQMPIKSYLWLHPTAKLSEADVKTLCDWANQESARLGGSGENPPR
jgi:hypothetical protein